MQTVNEIVIRYNKAKDIKQRWQREYDDCYKYFLPQTESSHINQPLYDSTGVITLASFASNLKHSLLPAWRKWFEIDVAYAQDSFYEAQIEKNVTEPIYQAINNSNFDLEVSEALLELGIGTGVLLINEGDKDNPLNIRSVPINSIVVEEDSTGIIENVYRQRELNATQIKSSWPEIELASQNESKYSILEATVYNEKLKFYDYLIIDLKRETLLLRDKFTVSPWIVFRWNKHAGEIYGRGPALQCLPDIKEANKLKELILQNAVLSVTPTYLVANDGVINPQTVKIKPGGVIPVRNLGGGMPIAPLPRGASLNDGVILLEKARDRVKQTLFYNRLAEPEVYARSATEVVLRQEQLNKEIGSSFARLQTELLNKIIKRVIYILDKKGMIMPLNQNLGYKLRYTSPLAKLQDNEDLKAIERILPLADRFPEEFRLSLKTEELAPWIAKLSGVSASLLRTEAEKDNIARLVQDSTNSEPQS